MGGFELRRMVPHRAQERKSGSLGFECSKRARGSSPAEGVHRWPTAPPSTWAVRMSRAAAAGGGHAQRIQYHMAELLVR